MAQYLCWCFVSNPWRDKLESYKYGFAAHDLWFYYRYGGIKFNDRI